MISFLLSPLISPMVVLVFRIPPNPGTSFLRVFTAFVKFLTSSKTFNFSPDLTYFMVLSRVGEMMNAGFPCLKIAVSGMFILIDFSVEISPKFSSSHIKLFCWP